MHLEDGAVTPACAAISMTLAAAGVGMAAISLRRESQPFKNIPLAITLGSVVFAAQMINFPVSGLSSAHLVGGALLAWTLGPAVGLLAMATVLGVQAACLGDGGLFSLGANVVNMAVIPALVVMAVRRMSFTRSASGEYAGIALASSAATIAGAAALVGQVALLRADTHGGSLWQFAAQMMTSHAVIAVVEAVLACLALAVVRAFVSRDAKATAGGPVAMGGLALVLIALVPLGSELRDGYEAAVHAAGLDEMIAASSAPAQAAQNLQQMLVGLWPSQQILAAVLATAIFALMLLAILWTLTRAGKAPAPATVNA